MQTREPTLVNLLNQFEDIGGPESYGPEGLAIMIALWRKSSKLNWVAAFTMTNTEIQVQTGIKSRETLNVRRGRLAEAGLISYSPPPLGKSRGYYEVNFQVVGEPVQKMDNLSGNFAKAVGEPVQKMDNFADTVLGLKDTITTNTFDDLFDTFCEIHQKLDIHVRPLDVTGYARDDRPRGTNPLYHQSHEASLH